jgi:hypothetical protein
MALERMGKEGYRAKEKRRKGKNQTEFLKTSLSARSKGMKENGGESDGWRRR